MPYVTPGALSLSRNERTLTVTSPFWAVTHDLDRGGAPIAIHFAHGRPGSVLTGPISTEIDQFGDVRCRETDVGVEEADGAVDLVFSGRLCDQAGQAGPIAFRTAYRYTPYWIRREVILDVPAGTSATRISPLSATFDDRLTHWSAAPDPKTKPGRAVNVLGPHYDQEDGAVPEGAGAIFRDCRPPGWMSLYRLGGEGIQVVPAGDLAPWDAPADADAQGDFRLSRQGDALHMDWDVLAAEQPLALPPRLTFAAYLTLVNLPATRPVPMRTVMIGNPPFPSDAQLAAWAQSGVQLIAIMEGASWTSGTDRYWRTGTYPCYRDDADMRDLDRLIASAHAVGLKIIPYTCPTELHPEAPNFAAMAGEWHIARKPRGQVIYHAAGKSPGGCYGALMCPDAAGWRRHYVEYIGTLLANHDFDGLYVDCVWKALCHNTAHGEGLHGGFDGLIDAFDTARKVVGPDRLVVVHNSESEFFAAWNNYADMIVTLEGVSWFKSYRYDLEGVSRVLRAFPACAVSMVPCSTWYRVPPPHDRRTGLRDGIAKGLLLGSIPYSYAMWETRWGYQDNAECLADPRGLYAAFRRLSELDLDGSRFEDYHAGTVQTNRKGVLGARYRGRDRDVLLLANVSGRDLRGVRWRCGSARGVIAVLAADDYAFVETIPSSSVTPVARALPR